MPAMSDLVSPTRMHSGDEALSRRVTMTTLFSRGSGLIEICCSNDDKSRWRGASPALSYLESELS